MFFMILSVKISFLRYLFTTNIDVADTITIKATIIIVLASNLNDRYVINYIFVEVTSKLIP